MRKPHQCLTPKEGQVATLVWQGMTNREIASLIGTTEQVVKNYLRTTFDKLGVWSRLELALYVSNRGGVRWLDGLHEENAIAVVATGLSGDFRKAG
jgi:DNA-binding NarL/FixJ family response regulator